MGVMLVLYDFCIILRATLDYCIGKHMAKKRHHYVPQLYLKYFSNDKKNITVFSVNEDKIVAKKAPIHRQCYKNYMYSKDQRFEDAMSLLEGATKKIFENILTSDNIPRRKETDYITLLIFVLYQSARTLFATEQLNEMVDKMAKSIMRDDIKFRRPKGITLEDIEKLTVSSKEPGLLSLGIVSRMIPLLLDLECKLITNDTSNEFITSDNPVIRYNKYYLNDMRSYTGFACKGLIILFPITPNYYLIYYDSIIYRIGGKKLHTPVTQLTQDDVDHLNILQLINANKTVYTSNMDDKYLQNISAKSKKYRFTDKTILRESEYVDHGDGKKSQLLWIARQSIKYDANTSFIRISKKIPEYYQRQNLVRDPVLRDSYREFCERVKKKEYTHNEWVFFD